MQAALEWGAATHVGSVRDVNQDAILAGPWVFAVADGMGGHAAGEVASSLTIAELAACGQGAAPTTQSVRAAVVAAHRRIRAVTAERPETSGMGSTLAMVALCRTQGEGTEDVVVVSVGDSRVYRAREGALAQLTSDHSVVQELVDAGIVRPEDAAAHPDRNAITRALGVEETVDPSLSSHPVVAGDRYLICSDGLWEVVAPAELEASMCSGTEPPQLARQLVDRAVAAGARDNVSAVVVDLRRTPSVLADRVGVADEATLPGGVR